jgi:hypothetical protein
MGVTPASYRSFACSIFDFEGGAGFVGIHALRKRRGRQKKATRRCEPRRAAIPLSRDCRIAWFARYGVSAAGYGFEALRPGWLWSVAAQAQLWSIPNVYRTIVSLSRNNFQILRFAKIVSPALRALGPCRKA